MSEPHGELRATLRRGGAGEARVPLELSFGLPGRQRYRSLGVKMSKGNRPKWGKHTVPTYPLHLCPVTELHLNPMELLYGNVHILLLDM